MTDSLVEFSCATQSQLNAILDFWAENAENHARPSDSMELLEQLLTRDPDALIIATLENKVVGTVIAGWDGWRGSIYRLAVDKNLKRNGLGRELMAKAEERLSKLGATRVNAMVFQENKEAHPFYERIGYSIQNEWRRWIKKI
jgi:ribosomal protein S18 acetylase RimI-like enzyme